MIGFINGKLHKIMDGYILVDNNGVGYKIFVSKRTIEKLPDINESFLIYTHMNVREDDISLFGFMTLEEINMYNLLKSVSGIASKSALSILDAFTPIELIMFISNDDDVSITKAHGIGKKTAQRIILELKDKMKKAAMEMDDISNEKYDSVSSSDKQDAIDALIALGYSKKESVEAVYQVDTIGLKTSEIISMALKELSKK